MLFYWDHWKYVSSVISYTSVSYLIYVVVPNDAEMLSPLQ